MGDGVSACLEAFERLKSGSPIVSSHVGIERAKITAGIVSVEAGFDRGYLKKSRASHLPLLALIESYRNSAPSAASSKSIQVRRANEKWAKANDELEMMRERLYRVVEQNIQLVERVRNLEAQLKEVNNVSPIK